MNEEKPSCRSPGKARKRKKEKAFKGAKGATKSFPVPRKKEKVGMMPTATGMLICKVTSPVRLYREMLKNPKMQLVHDFPDSYTLAK